MLLLVGCLPSSRSEWIMTGEIIILFRESRKCTDAGNMHIKSYFYIHSIDKQCGWINILSWYSPFCEACQYISWNTTNIFKNCTPFLRTSIFKLLLEIGYFYLIGSRKGPCICWPQAHIHTLWSHIILVIALYRFYDIIIK